MGKSNSYNKTLENLVLSTEVNSPERLIGMLAYSKYKIRKHEWVSKNKAEKDYQNELNGFLKHYDNQEVLNDLKTEANDILLRFVGSYNEAVVKEKLKEEKEKALLLELKKLHKDLDSTKNSLLESINQSYMKPVWQSVIGSVIFAAIIFLIGILIRFSYPQSNISKLIQYVLAPEKYNITIKEVKP